MPVHQLKLQSHTTKSLKALQTHLFIWLFRTRCTEMLQWHCYCNSPLIVMISLPANLKIFHFMAIWAINQNWLTDYWLMAMAWTSYYKSVLEQDIKLKHGLPMKTILKNQNSSLTW